MRIKYFVTFISTLLLVSSCHKNSTEDPKVTGQLLSLIIDSSFPTDLTDNWVVVYDAAGNIVDYKPFESSSSITISTTKSLPGSTITIAFVENYTATPIGLNVIAYADITPGATWTLTSEKQNQQKRTLGNTIVNIKNFPGNVEDFTMTDQNGIQPVTQDFGSGSFQIPTTEGRNHYFIVIRTKDGVVKQLNYESNGADTTFSYNNFQNPDEIISVPIPSSFTSSSTITANTTDQTNADAPITYDDHFDIIQQSTLQLGYIDSLTNYQTNIIVSSGGNHEIVFTKYGGIPKTVSWPSTEGFSINNTSIDSASFTIGQPISYRRSSWNVSNSSTSGFIYWTVFSTSSSQKLSDLPSELLHGHTELSNSHLIYGATSYFTTAPDYQSAIDNLFKGVKMPVGTEIYFVNIN